MASGAPDSLRGTVQRNLSRILFEPSPLATSQSWACTSLRDARAPVLQQSGDFWMRVDCHWESPPQSIFLTLESEHFVAAIQLWLDQTPCCLDADCGRRMQILPPDSIESPDFRDMIESWDKDDCIITIIENERQHGRFRVSRPRKTAGLVRASTEANCVEWSLEHKARGFDLLRTWEDSIVEDRLRVGLRALKRAEKEASPRTHGSNPRQSYVFQVDAQRNNNRKRSWAVMLASRRQIA